MITKPIYAFNIFTGTYKAFPSVQDALKGTNVSTSTLYNLLKVRRPNFNTGWVYSRTKRKIWVSVSDIRQLRQESPAKYDRLFSGKYHLLTPHVARYGLVRLN